METFCKHTDINLKGLLVAKSGTLGTRFGRKNNGRNGSELIDENQQPRAYSDLNKEPNK